jgi:hypothetical protein
LVVSVRSILIAGQSKQLPNYHYKLGELSLFLLQPRSEWSLVLSNI